MNAQQPLPALGGDADPPSHGAAPTKLSAALRQLVAASHSVQLKELYFTN